MLRNLLASAAVLASLGACTIPAEDAPVARAGIDRYVPAGDRVTLVGGADRETEFQLWTVVSAPGPHLLAGGTSARAIFTPAAPGTYVLSLEVFAGSARSEPDYMQITAIDCDRDGDGSRAEGRICRGADCDDSDPAISPRAEDVCEDQIDQDCDGIDERCCPRDDDGDGYTTVLCPGGDDCNDTDNHVHPGMFDVCNGVDDDCNGLDDGRDCQDDLPCENGVCGCEPRLETCDDGVDQDCDGADLLSDEDGDAHQKAVCGRCNPALDCATAGGLPCCDCDDTDQRVFPGATELCGNGKDEDCDGVDPALDFDGDTYPPEHCHVRGVPADCNDLDASIHPGAPDLCFDGIDQNCDRSDAIPDADHDGHVSIVCGGLDCDDTNPWIKPGGIESCNLADDDCNGAIDDLPPIQCGPPVGEWPLLADGSVANWLLLGPFSLANICWDETTRLANEAGADPSAGDGWFGLRWLQHRADTGAVDLGRALPGSSVDPTRRGAYLFTRLIVPAPAHFQVRLEASDAAELWIDGQRQPLPATAVACNRSDVETAVVYLDAGAHRVLVRTGSNGTPWTVRLRLYTPRSTEPGPDRPATEVQVNTGAGSFLGVCEPGLLECDPVAPASICADFVGPSPESCATLEDDDCDGVVNEPDEDADGVPGPGCSLPGYAGPADCNERHRQVGPGQPELCDGAGADENCDGVVNDLPASSCGSGPTDFLSADGEVGEWLVLGPIDTPGLVTDARLDKRDLTALLGGAPEAFARAYPGQVVGPFAWTPVKVPADRVDGWVSLPAALPGRDFDRTTTLALATLWVPEEAQYRFEVTGGGAFQIQLDGLSILDIGPVASRSVASAFPVLDAGPHRVLVKLTVAQNAEPGFGLRITRAGGAPATELGLDLGRGVLRGACVPGVRTCGQDGWSGCVGALSAVPEKCNRLDDDCNGVLPLDERDADADGVLGCQGDCDDGRPDVGPGGVEVCDGRDNDCDGLVDSGPGLGGVELCGVATAVCEPLRTGCPASLARCMAPATCDGDGACVARYGAGWLCAGGDRCIRCGAP